MAIATATFMLAVSWGAYRHFNESVVVNKAARLIAADVALTRSYAIQRRTNVSLVANETARSYVIRDTTGAVLAQREFDFTSGMPLGYLDVPSDGDSLTFNSRGLLTSGAGTQLWLGKGGRTRYVYVNALGRYKVSDVVATP